MHGPHAAPGNDLVLPGPVPKECLRSSVILVAVHLHHDPAAVGALPSEITIANDPAVLPDHGKLQGVGWQAGADEDQASAGLDRRSRPAVHQRPPFVRASRSAAST